MDIAAKVTILKTRIFVGHWKTDIQEYTYIYTLDNIQPDFFIKTNH